MRSEGLRKEILQACTDCIENGLFRSTGASGNISARDPESGLIAITPSQVRYGILNPEDILLINVDGEVVESKPSLKPSSETPTHTLIYREFSDINAVIHSHPTYANVLGLLYDEIPAVYIGQAYFVGGAVPVANYTPVGSEEMAKSVVENLKNSSVMVIRNHGLVATGKNLGEALQRSLATEDNSEIYCKARNLGELKPMTGVR